MCMLEFLYVIFKCVPSVPVSNCLVAAPALPHWELPQRGWQWGSLCPWLLCLCEIASRLRWLSNWIERCKHLFSLYKFSNIHVYQCKCLTSEVRMQNRVPIGRNSVAFQSWMREVRSLWVIVLRPNWGKRKGEKFGQCDASEIEKCHENWPPPKKKWTEKTIVMPVLDVSLVHPWGLGSPVGQTKGTKNEQNSKTARKAFQVMIRGLYSDLSLGPSFPPDCQEFKGDIPSSGQG